MDRRAFLTAFLAAPLLPLMPRRLRTVVSSSEWYAFQIGDIEPTGTVRKTFLGTLKFYHGDVPLLEGEPTEPPFMEWPAFEIPASLLSSNPER